MQMYNIIMNVSFFLLAWKNICKLNRKHLQWKGITVHLDIFCKNEKKVKVLLLKNGKVENIYTFFWSWLKTVDFVRIPYKFQI